jgi:hypothetical protein
MPHMCLAFGYNKVNLTVKELHELGVVVHTYNPSYWGDGVCEN